MKANRDDALYEAERILRFLLEEDEQRQPRKVCREFLEAIDCSEEYIRAVLKEIGMMRQERKYDSHHHCCVCGHNTSLIHLGDKAKECVLCGGIACHEDNFQCEHCESWVCRWCLSDFKGNNGKNIYCRECYMIVLIKNDRD